MRGETFAPLGKDFFRLANKSRYGASAALTSEGNDDSRQKGEFYTGSRNEAAHENEVSPTLSNEDAAYLAGLIDGDGHIGLHKRRTSHSRTGYTYQAHVEISSVNERFLREIQRMVKTRCWKTINPGFKSKRPMYHLTVTPNGLRWLLPLLVPYLRLKREQALAVLEHLSLVKKGRHGHHPRSEELHLRLRYLNHRGKYLWPEQ